MGSQFALRQAIRVSCRLAQLTVFPDSGQFGMDVRDGGPPEHVWPNFRRSAMVDVMHLYQVFRFQARGDHQPAIGVQLLVMDPQPNRLF